MMRDCIFTAHCLESVCDKSCPAYVQTTYMLERNGLINSNSVYTANENKITESYNLLDTIEGKTTTLVVPSGKSIEYADIVTYCAICKYWRGSQLHMNVYHLRYSSYIENVKKSWSKKTEPEDLEYSDIWIKSCKVLIVSGFDFVNFGDFESQTFLNIIQERRAQGLTNIVVSPKLNSLISTKSSIFFRNLKSILSDSAKAVNV